MGLTHLALFNLVTDFGIRWVVVEPSIAVRWGLRRSLPRQLVEAIVPAIQVDAGNFDLAVVTSPTAAHAEAHRALNLAFDRGEPRKRYLALVRGAPPAERRIDLAIAPARRGRMRPARRGDPHGKEAATLVRLLEAFPARPWAGGDLALVEALPETGRTHQIRVHLAAEGFPLAVDPDYGDEVPLRGPDGRILLERTPLHAASLEVRHPARGGALTVEAPLPADLAAALEALRAG